MANELGIRGYISGATITADVVDSAATVVQADIALTEGSAGNYVGSVGTPLAAGVYAVNFKVGTTFIAAGELHWNGIREVDFYPEPEMITEGTTLSVDIYQVSSTVTRLPEMREVHLSC